MMKSQTNHKTVALQYAFTAMAFLFFGFFLVTVMRLQLAYPQGTFVWLEKLFPEGFPAGTMTPDFYNQLGAMHGTIMVFLGVVPLAVGAFGNYLVPLMLGSGRMAFPRLNAASYWCYFVGGGLMLASFFVVGGPPQAGWTSYPPLATVTPGGQTLWLWGMLFLAASSILGAVNMIVTIFHFRSKELNFLALPIFVWTQLATAFLLLLAFPPLGAASVLQLMDRILGSSFFMPSGLMIGGQALANSGGGNPILWQHLFWFLAHPEVYVLILPAIGIVAEILTANTGRPLYGYRTVVYSIIFLTVMSFLVWAHHMFLAGMGTQMSNFFQLTTMIISIPSIAVLTTFLLTLWGGPIRINVPMCFALAFLPMFGLGGLTGLPLGLAASDLHLHDTYYVIGHFHYIVAPGTLFALFAGVYFWFPKFTGKMFSVRLGKIHFWGSLVTMNGIFFPMFLVGMAGVSRRWYDLSFYRHGAEVFWLNKLMSASSWLLALFQFVFVFNLMWSAWKGARAEKNPWKAATRDWQENRSPEQDFSSHAHPLTGLRNGAFGCYLFLSSQVMFFGALVTSFIVLKTGDSNWQGGPNGRLFAHPWISIGLLFLSSTFLFLSRKNLISGNRNGFRSWGIASLLLTVVSLTTIGLQNWVHWHQGYLPSTANFHAFYFLLGFLFATQVTVKMLGELYALITERGESLLTFSYWTSALGLGLWALAYY